MRLSRHLAEEPAAQLFGDYLFAQGIQNQLEHDPDGWGIWIAEEDRITQAASLLALFRENPTDPKYRTEAQRASKLREEAKQDHERYRTKVRNRRHLFRPITSYGFGPLTFVLIVISVAVFILSKFGHEHGRIM